MTPRERAEKLKQRIAMSGSTRAELSGDMVKWVEQALIEERKAAIEEEREACALSVETADVFWGDPQRTLEIAAVKIRARSS